MIDVVQPYRVWRRPLLGPIILIALGVLLLLTNTGVVSWDVWATLWRYWPILLVLLGLELLLVGRASWGAVLFTLLVLMILGAISGGFSTFNWFGPARGGIPFSSGATGVEQGLEGAQAADIYLTFGAGRLEISGGAGEGMLAEGSLESDGEVQLSRRYQVNDGVGRLDLQLEGPRGGRWFFPGPGTANALTVRLSDQIPIQRLEINAGAAEENLDLSSLQLQRLDLETGASSVRARLPARGDVNASVSAGASSVTLEIPEGVAARIRVQGGLASFNIDETRFPPVGRNEGVPGLATKSEYQSSDFATAQNRIDLNLSAGAGSITVR